MTALSPDQPVVPEAWQGSGAEVGRGGPDASSRGLARRLLHDRNALIGSVIVVVFVVVALLAPLVAPEDPLRISPERLEPPSRAHLLGTDGLGRDLLSRIAFGARSSLGTAALAAQLVTVIGVAVGTVAGYFGGLLDSLLMRIVDLLIALPGMVFTFAIVGLFDPSLLAVLIGIVALSWVGLARVVRSLVLSARERSYVEASRAGGAGHLRVISRHVLPNVMPGVIVLVTMRTARLILAIAGLSFLGLGAQPPAPEWGAMLNESRPFFPSSPHVTLVPGLAVILVAVGVNLLGDGLRDVLDPRLGQSVLGPDARPSARGRRRQRVQ